MSRGGAGEESGQYVDNCRGGTGSDIGSTSPARGGTSPSAAADRLEGRVTDTRESTMAGRRGPRAGPRGSASSPTYRSRRDELQVGIRSAVQARPQTAR